MIAFDRSNAASSSGVWTCTYFGTTPATGARLDLDQRQLLRAVANATPTRHRPSVLAGKQGAAAPPWVACDPTPARLLPSCDRDFQSRSQIDHFSCGAVRTPAQAFFLRRGAYRTPSQFSD